MFHILALSLLAMPPLADQMIYLSTNALVEHLDRPLAELIEGSQAYSSDDFKAMRTKLERERDEKIERSEQLEEQWKDEVSAARRELRILNNASSVDTEATSHSRAQLHAQIATLERHIQQEARKREKTIPEFYEVRLAKLRLIEHWPERLEEVVSRIDAGRARDRDHGDVDDIGYRKIVEADSEDIEVGEQAARQMAASGSLPPELPDPDVQLYVRRLASKLAANSDLRVPLRVTVLEEAMPRAIGLPGGVLYITSGVLRTARSESELAGVLSLEIARIAARHGTRGSRRSLFAKMVLPLAQVATGFLSGGLHPSAYYGIGFGMQGLDGAVNRALNGTDEGYNKEADQLGIQYAWKAGFDPRGLVGFLDSLIEENRSALIGRKPPIAQRVLDMFTEIAYLPQAQRPVVDSPEFDAARQKITAAE